jgi:hypothetical protein
MEEARHELDDALEKAHSQRQDRNRGGFGKAHRRGPNNTNGKRSSRSDKTSWTDVRMDSIDLDQRRTGFLRLGLARTSGRFFPEEVFQQRPGSCFEIEAVPQGTEYAAIKMLGSVAPAKPGSSSSFKLVMVVYDRASIDRLLLLLSGPPESHDPQTTIHGKSSDPQAEESLTPAQTCPSATVRWRIRFCVSLISQCRQFEACDYGSAGFRKRSSLLKKLMGQKEATHIRFESSDDENGGGGGGDASVENDACSEGEEEIDGYVTEEIDDDNLDNIPEVGDGDGDGDDGTSNNTGYSDDCRNSSKITQHSKLHLTMSSFTGLKALNPTQKIAANKFCSSDETKPTLELIQGPPGTGKTTFVVSVLARLLCRPMGTGTRRRNRRILVTAPTNKAVGVLAKRFLESCPGLLDHYGVPVSLIGVQDKLLEAKEDGGVDEGLKGIFCYTWLDSLAAEYERLFKDLSESRIGKHPSPCDDDRNEPTKSAAENRGLSPWLPKAFPSISIDTFMVGDDSDSDTEDEGESGNHCSRGKASTKDGRSASVIVRAKGLHVRLVRNLPRWSEASGAANLSRKAARFLADGDISAASAYIQALVKIFKADDSKESSSDSETNEMDERSVRPADTVPELLSSARIVFCTLSTAGASLMKKTRRFDDWVVDEAAAATEPELLIPLHLDPMRLLVVGDPKQLPASVSSPLSEGWGLGRSLHERLTIDLGRPQTMLDVQYRMRPEIAEFPSHQFYGGKLANGENVRDTSYRLTLSAPVGKQSNGGNLLETTPPFCFFQINGKEEQSFTGSYYNTEEAFALVALLQTIRQRCHRGRGENPSWCSPDKIRVVTFYSAQVTTLRQILHQEGLAGVLVATVDSSQGCEADLVILSFVRTTGAGFLRDDRRMNVALTRARHKLICLGNATDSSWASDRSNAGSSSSTLTSLLREARTKGCLSTALTEKK